MKSRWPRTAAALPACALAAIWAAPSSVHAYVRTTTLATKQAMHWNHRCLDITAYLGAPPDRLTADVFEGATRAAAATWSKGSITCTGLELRAFTAASAEGPAAYDGTNRLTFRNDEWCRKPVQPQKSKECYDRSALAITSVFANKQDGRILDADIEVNAVNFCWADLVANPTDGKGCQDIQNTLTHELGHLIGLDHNCLVPNNDRRSPVDHLGQAVPRCADATATMRQATMYPSVKPGAVERRNLSDDDRLAACQIYPVAAPQMCREDDGGGCSVASDVHRRGRGAAFRHVAGTLWPLAALLLLGLRRRRQRA